MLLGGYNHIKGLFGYFGHLIIVDNKVALLPSNIFFIFEFKKKTCRYNILFFNSNNYIFILKLIIIK